MDSAFFHFEEVLGFWLKIQMVRRMLVYSESWRGISLTRKGEFSAPLRYSEVGQPCDMNLFIPRFSCFHLLVCGCFPGTHHRKIGCSFLYDENDD